jgi:zinc transport system substrate-binding protein
MNNSRLATTFLFPVILIVVFCISCSSKIQQQNTITVTIEPQRYFAEQLADTLFQVVSMIAPGISPETYDPTPVQIAQLSQSKAYFYVGHLGFEDAWLDKLKKNNPQLPFYDTSEEIDLVIHENRPDPHTWTSPKEALTIVRNMCEAFIATDPDHTLQYQQNFEKLAEEIHATDTIIQSYLNRSSQKAFIIYHPILTYFARYYHLTQYSIEMEGKEPTPDQLKRLIDIAQKEQVKTVFIQQEFDKKNAEIIARETDCRLVVINPLSYEWSKEIIAVAKALADE